MNLDTLSNKQVNEVERLTRELLAVLKQAKLTNEPLAKSLRELEQEARRVRCERFDAVDSQYRGY